MKKTTLPSDLEMRRQLISGGWTFIGGYASVWKNPKGGLWVGTAGAWAVLNAQRKRWRYPVRCVIIDPGYNRFGSSVERKLPERALKHVGKNGVATRGKGNSIIITLEDGTVVRGSDCFWCPLKGQHE